MVRNTDFGTRLSLSLGEIVKILGHFKIGSSSSSRRH